MPISKEIRKISHAVVSSVRTACKDIDLVGGAIERAGISKRVARRVP